MKFPVTLTFHGQPYYYNCRECGEPLVCDGDAVKMEKTRQFGFCEACRPLKVPYVSNLSHVEIVRLVEQKIPTREIAALAGVAQSTVRWVYRKSITAKG